MKSLVALVLGQRMSAQSLASLLWDDTYPIIHIDPDYRSLQEDSGSEEEDKFEKRDSKLPVLIHALPYPINGKIKLGRLLVPKFQGNEVSKYIALEISVEEHRAYIIYDVAYQLPEGTAYHPIAVLKSPKKYTRIRFSRDIAGNKQFIAMEKSGFYDLFWRSPDGEPSTCVPSLVDGLVKKHFMFSAVQSNVDVNTYGEENFYNVAEYVPPQYTPYQGGLIKIGQLLFSYSLNISSAQTIDESNAIAVTISSSQALNIATVHSRLLDSASRQCSKLCENVAHEFATDDGDTEENVVDRLEQRAEDTDNELYSARHVHLAWCALFAAYATKIKITDPSESGRYLFRSKMLGLIANDTAWKQTTIQDLHDPKFSVPSRLLQNLLYRFTQGNVQRDELDQLSDILGEQLKITFASDVFNVVPLNRDEAHLADQFRLHANYYKRIWDGLKIGTSYGQDAPLQLLAQYIEQKPYYYGAYAAEIDRIGKAFATSEIECVAEYRDDDLTTRACRHGVDMDKIPEAGQKAHPHPVAEYFNAGMVMILTHLLRLGHNVKAVPYLQKINEGEMGKFPWPLSPAMEIAFKSGRVYYHPAKILWLDYANLRSSIAILEQQQGMSVAAFAERLLQRSKMLYYLPAIAIVKRDDNGNVVVERSHGESEPPIAIISIYDGTVEIAATLYREQTEIETGSFISSERMIEDRIASEFDGFCPQSWNIVDIDTSSVYEKCYVMERICMGLSIRNATIGKDTISANFMKFVQQSKLFGIPE